MIRGVIILALAGIPVAGLVGCSTAPETHSAQMDLKARADQALAQAERTDPSLRNVLNNSAGYAVFPDVGKGGFVVGAAYGKGVLYQNGQFVGYTDMSQASVGALAGGQSFTEIIALKTPDAVQKYKNGEVTFGADATAVGLKAGAAADAQFKDNVAVFITNQSGLMASAALNGQSFKYTSASDVGNPVQPAGGQLQGPTGTLNTTTPQQ